MKLVVTMKKKWGRLKPLLYAVRDALRIGTCAKPPSPKLRHLAAPKAVHFEPLESRILLAGDAALLSSSTVNIGGSSNFLSLIGGKIWINEGTLTVGGDDFIYFGGFGGGTNTLTNAAGATLNLSSTYANPFEFYTSTATLNNAGTLNQMAAGVHAIPRQ